MTSKEQTEFDNLLKVEWPDASLEERFHMIAGYYLSALHSTANVALMSASDGIFAHEVGMNYGWVQDVVQEALLDAYEYLSVHPDHKVRHPKAWFRTITRRAATEVVRQFYLREKNSELNFSLDNDDWVEVDLAERAQAQELRDVMSATLTEEERILLWAKYVDEDTYEELAWQTGKPISSLKSMVNRAKAKVRRALEQRCPRNAQRDASVTEMALLADALVSSVPDPSPATALAC